MKAFFLGTLLIASAVCCAAQGLCVRRIVAPGYPRLARIAKMQGEVTVDIGVSADGRVVSVKTSGADELLKEASAENARQWTFCPTRKAPSEPLEHLIVTYIYRLDGGEEYYDPPPRLVFDLPQRIEITTHPYKPQT
jgi:TonB family protein